MTFLYNNRDYTAPTATEIVRAIERDTEEFSENSESIQSFLGWSLSRLTDQIHMRELVASTHVSEETLALNYLFLLDEHHLGSLSGLKENAAAER